MRGKRRKNDALANVILFSSCDDKEIEQIASIATEVSIPAGTTLARQGEAGREFYVILDGKASVAIDGKGIATLGPGDFFGEMALLDQGPRAASVTADTDLEVIVLEPREFVTLIDDHPAVARKILKAMAQRLREAEHAPTH